MRRAIHAAILLAFTLAAVPALAAVAASVARIAHGAA